MPGSGLVVWYNTRCPVCDAGIDWQRNKLVAAVRVGKISFEDINQEPEALAAHGVSLDDVRRRLHAIDESGRLVVGADVMIAVWRATKGEGWLATLFGNPMVLMRFGIYILEEVGHHFEAKAEASVAVEEAAELLG